MSNSESQEYASSGGDVVFDLSLTRNPVELPDDVLDLIHDFGSEKVKNYQFRERIEGKLRQHLGTEEKVFFTNGCDGALDLVAQAYFEPGIKVAIPVPSFPRYEIHVEKTGASKEFVNSENDHPDIKQMAESNADFMILANPINPTGERFSIGELKELKSKFDGKIVLDEAMRIGESQTELVEEDLILIGSFSKLYGLAGLRAGYLVTSESEVEQIISPFQANSVALGAVEKIIQKEEFLEETRSFVDGELEFLKQELSDLGINYSDSVSFSLVLDFDEKEISGGYIHERLRSSGIKTVKGSNFRGLNEEYIRVSIGDRKANSALIQQLEEILAQKQKTLKNTGGKL